MTKFQLPELPYAYADLEPYIDAETMEIHHSKHHQGYTDKLNTALEGHDDLQDMSIEELLKSLDKLPEDIRKAVRNNGGGFYNHSLFWEMMTPGGSELNDEKLEKSLADEFGSVEEFKQQFSDKAGTVFGSGWAWLVKNADGSLEIMEMPNQDNPIMEHEVTPILGLDVWEHAYYLKHQNKRPDYIADWWNLVNWEKVAEMYHAA